MLFESFLFTTCNSQADWYNSLIYTSLVFFLRLRSCSIVVEGGRV